MKTITVTLDEDTYAKAEHKAAALETSVSRVAADFVRLWATGGFTPEQARDHLRACFAQPNWRFAVGQPDDRTQRNARR
jgi:hypothetical protein